MLTNNHIKLNSYSLTNKAITNKIIIIIKQIHLKRGWGVSIGELTAGV